MAAPDATAVEDPVACAPRRRRSQRQVEESEQNRSTIVRSALELFATHGYTKTTLHAVADRVGLTRQGVLHHFRSKEGLFLEVIEASHRWAGRQGEASETVAGLAGLRMLSHFVGIGNDDVHVKLAHTLQAEAMHDDAPPYLVRYAQLRLQLIRQHITDRLREAQAEGSIAAELDVSTLATMLTGTITGLQAQSLIDDSVRGAAAFGQLIDVLVAR